MAVTVSPYGPASLHLGNGLFDFETDGPAGNIKVALLDNTYTPDVDTHSFFNDVNFAEVSGTGYTAGGASLTSVTWNYDSDNNRSVLTAANTTWATATFTARYAVVYKNVGGEAMDSPLLSYVDFGEDLAPVGVDFIIPWSVNGVFRLNLITP